MLDRRAQVNERVRRPSGVCLVVAVSFTVLLLVWAGSAHGPVLRAASGTSAVMSWWGGVVAGIFLAGTALSALPSRGRHGGPNDRHAMAGLVVAGQSLVVTLALLVGPPGLSPAEAVPVLIVTLVGAVAVTRTLTGALRESWGAHKGHDLGLGLGLGLTAAGHVLFLPTPVSGTAQAVIVVVGATHVAAASLAVRQRALSVTVRALLVATVLTFVTSLGLAQSGLDGSAWALLASAAQGVVGAAWLAIAWTSLQRQAREDRRQLEAINETLLETARDQRERLHELRSTMAGLVAGSTLMDSAELAGETRQRLWESLRRELARMQRLLSYQDDSATDLDLDQSLGLILDLQRLKGRRVELRSCGDSVRARYDALAEVVNILMDNAVTHGGSNHSLVEVERRDDHTVDITVTDSGRGIPREEQEHIFEWGRRGADSPGEGIGLHLAQRLVSEDGGSLHCAEPKDGRGSSFVISLPAARVSAENHSALDSSDRKTDRDSHVASRRSG